MSVCSNIYSLSLSLSLSVAERPQHMLMRVAIGIHGENLDAAIEVTDYAPYCPILIPNI